ncbi:transglutaminase-like domain-containing protein [Virgibacillus chiguensis]|uniref:Transglutaminase-like superfamily protein n=1 Tax=Virgibacillus chiguensis TaxID=411959 RepID=A0A1M5SVL8_9BACI|nr:transglutaminase family protein [Virgibacillus chiguensis]SHH42529.1 Transglutaminase-like superfamily protein [Virgibacillus chiguensis]
MEKYLSPTSLLDFEKKTIQRLIQDKEWKQLDDYNKIKSCYEFVQNDILFGYNKKDQIPASKILKNGYGQCNTKSILFMALLRAVSIPCRIRGFWIDKEVQKGLIPNWIYEISPALILHSWVEVFYEDVWYALEGLIIDEKYLRQMQLMYPNNIGFCGFGISTTNLQNPCVEWNQANTYIQQQAIIEDLGVFATPDELFYQFEQSISPVKQVAFSIFIRHIMNRKAKKIRNKV